jgi:hypothetical protein
MIINQSPNLKNKEMKSTLSNLQGVNVLGRAQQKQIKGSGPCGVKDSNGTWHQITDGNGNGATRDDALQAFNDGTATGTQSGNSYDIIGWCCDSCPWN